jgi:hypothetical protein
VGKLIARRELGRKFAQLELTIETKVQAEVRNALLATPS